MSGYGPQFRPRKKPKPETNARRVAASWARSNLDAEKERALEPLGGRDAVLKINPCLLGLLDQLRIPHVRFPAINEVAHYVRKEDAVLAIAIRDEALLRMRDDTIGKRLRGKPLDAIRAAMALGDGDLIDETIRTMIRQALLGGRR
jgi:hypothetical protein